VPQFFPIAPFDEEHGRELQFGRTSNAFCDAWSLLENVRRKTSSTTFFFLEPSGRTEYRTTHLKIKPSMFYMHKKQHAISVEVLERHFL
jgi:hypothetical protein